MKIISISICTVSVVVLSACVSFDPNTVSPPSDFKTLEITLDRSSCFGTCPDYVVKVTGEGNVSYCGFTYVQERGRRTRQINPNEVRALFNQIRAAKFFDLKESYRANITDSPLYIISVSVDGQNKTVFDYVGREVGMPESVTLIQDQIDDITGTSEWIGQAPNDHHLGAIEYHIPDCEDEFRPSAKDDRKKLYELLVLDKE